MRILKLWRDGREHAMTSPDERQSADGHRSFDQELEHALCKAQPSRFGNAMRAVWAALPSGWLLVLVGVLVALIFNGRSASRYRDDLTAIQRPGSHVDDGKDI
jgi:hypothetical protein